MPVEAASSSIAPYRIDAKVKNNRLWRAVLTRWPDVKNQADAAQRLQLGATDFGELLNMRVFPGHVRDGKIRYWKRALRAADILGVDVDYLFDHKLYGGNVPGRLVVEVGLTALAGSHTLELPPSPEAQLIDREKTALVQQALETLTPQEQYIMERTFGLNDRYEGTLEEIGRECGISRERTRQIQLRALKKLRHPRRSRPLRSAYGL